MNIDLSKSLAYNASVMETFTVEQLSVGSILTMGGHKVEISNRHFAGRYKSAIVYLLQSDLSGYEVCPFATESCKAICLGTNSGHAAMVKRGNVTNLVQIARMRRTMLLKKHREVFMAKLFRELTNFCKCAKRDGVIPAFRFNGTSDLDFARFLTPSGETFVEYFGREFGLVCYDYTKSIARIKKYAGTNYHLTFSFTPEKVLDAIRVLSGGYANVAVGFATKKSVDFVGKYFLGSEVVSGDEHDLRFTDRKGVMVGLTAKGNKWRGKAFFIETENLADTPYMSARQRAAKVV